MASSNVPDRTAGRQVSVPARRRTQEPARLHASPPYRPVSPAFAIAPSVSVVIPARNEAANLPHVFGTLPSWVDEIILVDGHSVDDTVAVTRALCPQAKVVTQPGRGKGDALHAGFTAATGDILVMIDADGSTDGTEIIRFVGALVGGADFAKGSRFSSSGGSDDITGVRRYGNRLLSLLVNVMFGTHFTDLCYGYNAFWARHLAAIEVSSCSGFEVETLMNIRAAKAGLKIHEVPSHESPRIFGSSNLHAVRDGWRILKIIMGEWLSRGRKPGARGSTVTMPVPLQPDTAARPYRMPGPDREPSVYDRDIVAAMTEGDGTGVAAAFGRHAKGLYTYCRSQLTEPADAADAVRDTFVVAASEVSRLRQPDRLRAWLFALARNECRWRLRTAEPRGNLYEAAQAMDDTGTLGVVTPQAEFRAQARAALAGLDPVDREISELNLRHGFYGADLAEMLGVSPGQAHSLASRARSRFERSLGVLLLARSSRERCRELAAILDGEPGWRALGWRALGRQVKRHIRHCAVCRERKRAGLNPAILYRLLPEIRLPANLRRQTLGLISDPSPAAARRRARVLGRAGPWRRDGFPVQHSTPPASGWRISSVPAAGAAAAAVALLGGAMYYAGHPSGHDPVPAATVSRPPSAQPARSPGSVPVPARDAGHGPSVPRPGVSAPSALPGLAGAGPAQVRAPGSAAPSGPSPSRSPGRSPSPSTSPSPSPSPSSASPSPAASSAPPSPAVTSASRGAGGLISVTAGVLIGHG